MITCLQLGLQLKPVGLLNVNGFYDPLITFLTICVTKHFLAQTHYHMLTIERESDLMLDRLAATKHKHVSKPVHLATGGSSKQSVKTQ